MSAGKRLVARASRPCVDNGREQAGRPFHWEVIHVSR